MFDNLRYSFLLAVCGEYLETLEDHLADVGNFSPAQYEAPLHMLQRVLGPVEAYAATRRST